MKTFQDFDVLVVGGAYKVHVSYPESRLVGTTVVWIASFVDS